MSSNNDALSTSSAKNNTSDDTTSSATTVISHKFQDTVASSPEFTTVSKTNGGSETVDSSETACLTDTSCSTDTCSYGDVIPDILDNSDTDTASETESFVDALDNLHMESKDVKFNSNETQDASISSSDPNRSADFDYLNDEKETSHIFGTDSAEFDVYDDEKEKLSNYDESPESATVIDNECIKAKEALLSDDEKQERRMECRRLKELGNERYKEGDYDGAVDLYTDALVACLLSHTEDRAVIYSNRAAARMKQDKNEVAIEDCSRALELNPDYLKALLRRAELYEKTDKLDEALADYQKALERDPSIHQARAACMRLPDQIKERNEKMKDEMISKLKDLGNLVLRPFGLSTNNFQLQQDAATGGYSVKFQQNAS